MSTRLRLPMVLWRGCRLGLGRDSHVHLSCQMGQKSLHFLCPPFLRMTNAMKTDGALNPINIARCGARAVTVGAHSLSHPVEQFARFGGERGGVWHLVAFLSHLPSRRQEIYDKLSYNSR